MALNPQCESDPFENQFLQVEGQLSNRTIDYAIKCMGARIRKFHLDCDLKGEVISANVGSIGVKWTLIFRQ